MTSLRIWLLAFLHSVGSLGIATVHAEPLNDVRTSAGLARNMYINSPGFPQPMIGDDGYPILAENYCTLSMNSPRPSNPWHSPKLFPYVASSAGGVVWMSDFGGRDSHFDAERRYSVALQRRSTNKWILYGSRSSYSPQPFVESPVVSGTDPYCPESLSFSAFDLVWTFESFCRVLKGHFAPYIRGTQLERLEDCAERVIDRRAKQEPFMLVGGDVCAYPIQQNPIQPTTFYASQNGLACMTLPYPEVQMATPPLESDTNTCTFVLRKDGLDVVLRPYRFGRSTIWSSAPKENGMLEHVLEKQFREFKFGKQTQLRLLSMNPPLGSDADFIEYTSTTFDYDLDTLCNVGPLQVSVLTINSVGRLIIGKRIMPSEQWTAGSVLNYVNTRNPEVDTNRCTLSLRKDNGDVLLSPYRFSRTSIWASSVVSEVGMIEHILEPTGDGFQLLIQTTPGDSHSKYTPIPVDIPARGPCPADREQVAAITIHEDGRILYSFGRPSEYTPGTGPAAIARLVRQLKGKVDTNSCTLSLRKDNGDVLLYPYLGLAHRDVFTTWFSEPNETGETEHILGGTNTSFRLFSIRTRLWSPKGYSETPIEIPGGPCSLDSSQAVNLKNDYILVAASQDG